MAVYNANDKVIYFIPVSKINCNLFKIRLEKTKNNQQKYIHNAVDFLSLS